MRAKRARTTLMNVAAAASVGLPTAAQDLSDPMTLTTDPADKNVLPEFARETGSGKPDKATLDAVLVKLPRPTPLAALAIAADRGELIAELGTSSAPGRA
ncbi:hypothetical protein [Sphingomonas phyllosphaerae]|uniref:hypothetical protein n=1 Tax=Sphingomonas phyllosphaerae TaxID=257003 RepID=UPI0024134BC2|nr:hypothetical protein [Sphingomonas phyllosphaerae]